MDSQKSILALRRWIEEQGSTVRSLTSDEFLLRFLYAADFRLTRAKELLVLFWKYRTENPQWFTDRDLVSNASMRKIAETAYCVQLPQPSKDQHLIFIMRVGHYDSTCFTLDDVTKYAFAVSDAVNTQAAAQLHGFIIILDLFEVTLQHVPQFTADFARRYVDCWEKMYPVRLHQIHFYNYPNLFNPVYGLFRMYYYQDLGERIFFHSNTADGEQKNSLHDHVDPALLPEEYGGQLGSINGEINHSFLQWTRERNSSVIELDQYGIDLKQVPLLMDQLRQEGEISED